MLHKLPNIATILTSSDCANGFSSVNLSKCMSQALFPPKPLCQSDSHQEGQSNGVANEIDDMKVQMKSRCRRFGKHHSKVHTKVEQALKKNEFHGH